mmetsp:Transcript_1862/g.2954  ORF Transcript_1862/g.2954 Transcript_1862/m.2954 type:complete len:244 (+) Transcript_1862:203-934(+)
MRSCLTEVMRFRLRERRDHAENDNNRGNEAFDAVGARNRHINGRFVGGRGIHRDLHKVVEASGLQSCRHLLSGRASESCNEGGFGEGVLHLDAEFDQDGVLVVTLQEVPFVSGMVVSLISHLADAHVKGVDVGKGGNTLLELCLRPGVESGLGVADEFESYEHLAVRIRILDRRGDRCDRRLALLGGGLHDKLDLKKHVEASRLELRLHDLLGHVEVEERSGGDGVHRLDAEIDLDSVARVRR